ncbi:hypothetical protein PFISCL1PPCAC_24330, partial [Pristionchus fissidentatus]
MKRFREANLSEIRLDSFLEGLSGMVHIYIELIPIDDVTSSMDVMSRVLIVQGERFEVSADARALHSPYFESLLFGPFSEKNKTEVEIEGIHSEEFGRLIYTPTKGVPIQEDTVVELLMHADLFDIPFVKDRCVDYLIQHERIHSGSKSCASALSILMIFAQKFRLDRFTEFLISRMESIHQVVKCMELFSEELPIRSLLMQSFGSSIRKVPVYIRPEV